MTPALHYPPCPLPIPTVASLDPVGWRAYAWGSDPPIGSHVPPRPPADADKGMQGDNVPGRYMPARHP